MKAIEDLPSPNHDGRKTVTRPSLIILHYTGMASEAAALERLRDPSAKVSAHYVVAEDGRILRLVDEARRAWHAGRSCWRGERDINAHSVGIEIVNPGHEHGYRPFPPAQMDSVGELCRDIMARHAITPENVLAHSDVAPDRKEDPGELFDWKALAAQGVGVWPSPATSPAADETRFHAQLIRYGYDSELPFPLLYKAFCRHFYQEYFTVEGTAPDEHMRNAAARLQGLIP